MDFIKGDEPSSPGDYFVKTRSGFGGSESAFRCAHWSGNRWSVPVGERVTHHMVIVDPEPEATPYATDSLGRTRCTAADLRGVDLSTRPGKG